MCIARALDHGKCIPAHRTHKTQRTSVYVRVHMRMCMCMCLYICICVRVYVYVYVYVYAYICAYIFDHGMILFTPVRVNM